MKRTTENRPSVGAARAFGKACLTSCQKVLARINAAKKAIFAESTQSFKAPERLVQLALNEAEAIAWQTNYPHLLFPTLATEKIQSVARWSARQQQLREANRLLALTA